MEPAEVGRGFPVGSCVDGVRCRVVEDGGRHRFESVRVAEGSSCPAGVEARLREALEGRYPDEIDPARLGDLGCEKGNDCGRAFEKILLKVRQVLL